MRSKTILGQVCTDLLNNHVMHNRVLSTMSCGRKEEELTEGLFRE
jgi:hypothetical protein